MATIKIDRELCTGCGLCATICPEAFEIDDNNIAVVKGESCEGQDINEVSTQCPVEAIKVA